MQAAWGIVAGFIAVIFAIAAVTMMSDSLATTQRLAAGEMAEGIEVPVIGTVGDFPDPAHRHVVNVTADGTIMLDGETLSLDQLQAELKRRGALSTIWFTDSGTPSGVPISDGGLQVSGEHVLFRIDGGLSWEAADRIVATPYSARILRVWLVVRHEGDLTEGALGFPTTLDGSSIDMGGSIRLGGLTYSVDVVPDAGDGSPQQLYDALRALPPTVGRLHGFDVHLRIDGALTTRAAVRLWDAALRAQAPKAVGVQCAASSRSATLAPLPSTMSAAESAYSLYLVGAPPLRVIAPQPMPAIARLPGPAITLSPWMDPPDGERNLVVIPK